MLMHPSYDSILAAIRGRTDFTPDVALILGSGLSQIAAHVEIACEIPYGDIHEALKPSVAGHPGRLLLGRLGRAKAAVFAGRRHLYEGIPSYEATLPVQIARGLGAKGVVLTSAVGGLNETYEVGDLALICDHINLMGTNPIFDIVRSRRAEGAGPIDLPFVNLDGIYQAGFREELAAHARGLGASLHVGTLAAVLGPVYETPAERRMLRALGADMVSMSTAPEAIMARYLGLPVAAVALVTNKAGAGEADLSHGKVLESAGAYADRFASVLARLLELFP